MARKTKEPPIFIQKQTAKAVRQIYPDQQKSEKFRATWEDLDQIYLSIASGIVQVSEEIREHVAALERVGFYNKEAVNSVVKTAMEDMTGFSKALVAIRSRHEGMKGPIEDSDDNAEHIRISLDYEAIVHKFKALSFQTVQVLLTHLQDAQLKLLEMKQEEENKAKEEVNH